MMTMEVYMMTGEVHMMTGEVYMMKGEVYRMTRARNRVFFFKSLSFRLH